MGPKPVFMIISFKSKEISSIGNHRNNHPRQETSRYSLTSIFKNAERAHVNININTQNAPQLTIYYWNGNPSIMVYKTWQRLANENTGWAKLGLQLWIWETVLLFINFWIIFHRNSCEPTFAHPCIKNKAIIWRDLPKIHPHSESNFTMSII